LIKKDCWRKGDQCSGRGKKRGLGYSCGKSGSKWRRVGDHRRSTGKKQQKIGKSEARPATTTKKERDYAELLLEGNHRKAGKGTQTGARPANGFCSKIAAKGWGGVRKDCNTNFDYTEKSHGFLGGKKASNGHPKELV